MQNQDINITSLDHVDLKASLISFLQSTGKFNDFDFEGSSINTLIDVLVRTAQYDAYLANMVANESFIASAQIRQNVVSHAEKLSYISRSSTASRLICDIEVTPATTDNVPNSIVLEPGTPFIGNVSGVSYTFANMDRYTLSYSAISNTFKINDVELYQGILVTNKIAHAKNKQIDIPNTACDTSTLVVSTKTVTDKARAYKLATGIETLDSEAFVYFLSENTVGQYNISFGRDILGREPVDNTIISLSYIATQSDHAIGVNKVTAGSLISGYSNINVDVSTPSYGGSPKEDIESIRFNAPKNYQAQGRALTDSDYIPLIKRQFPFIRSAISWGGERNVPPVYGSVFISILSKQNRIITNAIKQQIISYVSDYNVASITPIITDPEQYNIDLDISFSFDYRVTGKSYADLSTSIIESVNEYNDELFNFDKYYNEAELNKRLMSIKGITSVLINKEVLKTLQVLRFPNPIYIVEFDNELKPNSISMESFELTTTGSGFKLYDDGLGNIHTEYHNSDNQKITSVVGVVDYSVGYIEFTLNLIQDSDKITVHAKTVNDNFYVTQNKVVSINKIETSELITQNRITSSTDFNG